MESLEVQQVSSKAGNRTKVTIPQPETENSDL